jgi:glycosyltransferase involved in cell wall biosynthesis
LKIVYACVTDRDYPRNSRLVRLLRTEFGAEVVVVEKSRSRNRVAKHIGQLRETFLASRDADIVVLSEFAIPFFWMTWAISKIRRSLHVVDFFVGQYETEVEDWNLTSPASARAKWLAWSDRAAIRSSDYCFTDTEVRAERFTAMSGTKVVGIPVGAPIWARPGHTPPLELKSGAPRLLYYGNYIPLHGVGLILEALKSSEATEWRAIFIGDGRLRPHYEEVSRQLGIDSRIDFLDSVPSTMLQDYLVRADLVFGVFGDSAKAAEVIPNKVWQGLYSGKRVVTRESAAYAKIEEIASHTLIQVPVDSSAPLAAMIDTLLSDTAQRSPEEVLLADQLENFVTNEAIAAWSPVLDHASRRSKSESRK